MIKKFALGILSLSLTVVAQAQIASDSASDATYQPPFNNWQNGDNGGFGFGAWSGLTDQYVGNSDVNGDGSNSQGSAPGQDIDTASQAPLTATGASWALRGDGNIGAAFRGLPALQVGQMLRLDFDNGYINAGQSVGFGLRSGATTRFEFFFAGGSTSYTVAGSTNQGTTQGFTDDGMRTYFTLTGANTYSFTVDWLGLGTGGDETFTGTLQNAGTIDTLRLFNFSNAGDPAGQAFYNSLQVVPEPSTWLAGAMTLGGCVYLRRRRKA